MNLKRIMLKKKDMKDGIMYYSIYIKFQKGKTITTEIRSVVARGHEWGEGMV